MAQTQTYRAKEATVYTPQYASGYDARCRYRIRNESIGRLGLYQIWLFQKIQIQPEPDQAEFRNSNPSGTGAGFG